MTLEQADRLALSKSKQGKELGELTVLGLGHVRSILKQVFEEHEKQLQEFVELLKAKDEEITKLKGKVEVLSDICIYDSKTRSIVAMLFWEWRKAKREKEYDMAESARCCFYQAYKMLKEKL